MAKGSTGPDLDLETPGPASKRAEGRVALVDLSRGAALVGMAVFHARWDMAWFELTPGLGVGPGWQLFGNVVAAMFLALSGLSLILAQRRGATRGGVFRRLGLLLATAMGVTLATWLVVPGMTIYFGILHCLAVGGALAWPLLRARLPILGVTLAAVFAAPLLPLPGSLQTAASGWLGLGSRLPATLDYRPLFPWAGFILLGVAIGRLTPDQWLVTRRQPNKAASALRWAGRHSLMLYLTHQAVLFPAIWLIALTLGGPPPGRDLAWSHSFERECRTDCLQTGADDKLCAGTCHCTRMRIEAEGVDSGLRLSPAAPEHRQRLAAITQACFGDMR